MTKFSFNSRIAIVTAVMLAGAACSKKVPIPPPPAPVAQQSSQPTSNNTNPNRPTATLTVEPSRIERGQSASLTWSTTNANDVAINNGIGTVAPSGRQSVSPTDTTTYTL